MIVGYRPFSEDNASDMIKSMQELKVPFYAKEWNKLTKDCMIFVKACLSPDPDLRPTAKKALNHSWISMLNYDNIGVDTSVNHT